MLIKLAGDGADSHTLTNNNAEAAHLRRDHIIEMYDLDISGNSESDDPFQPKMDDYHDEDTMNDDDIMDRWLWTAATYKELLSILNPSNNSFAYVAYQRWLNVKKLELDNDSFTRS